MLARLTGFLDEHHVRYKAITHSQAFTAQEIAESAHVPGKDLAKTVIVKVDDSMAMAVLPANYQINLEHLKDQVGAAKVELAKEQEFQDLFPGCERGGMPPFGNLYDMDVFVTESLAQDEEIVFNAGSHTELIQMAYKDFEKLVRPKVLRFSTRS